MICFFMYILLEVHYDFWIYGILIKFGKILINISLNIFPAPFSLLSFQNSSYIYATLLDSVSQVTEALLKFFIQFFPIVYFSVDKFY